MKKKDIISTISISILASILVFFVYNFYYGNFPSYSPPTYHPAIENIKNAWTQNAQFTNLQSSQQFAISDFQNQIILLNSFDPSYPFSLKQHMQIKSLREELGDSVIIISFDMSQNPESHKTLSYLENKGFNWYFAVPSEQNKQLLINDFGISFSSFSSNPIVLICPGGKIVNDFGPNIKTADQIKEKINEC